MAKPNYSYEKRQRELEKKKKKEEKAARKAAGGSEPNSAQDEQHQPASHDTETSAQAPHPSAD